MSNLAVIKSKPNQLVIQQIEELLEMAKAGEVTGFACITINTERCIGESWAGSCDENVIMVIGALESLKVRFTAVHLQVNRS